MSNFQQGSSKDLASIELEMLPEFKPQEEVQTEGNLAGDLLEDIHSIDYTAGG